MNPLMRLSYRDQETLCCINWSFLYHHILFLIVEALLVMKFLWLKLSTSCHFCKIREIICLKTSASLFYFSGSFLCLLLLFSFSFSFFSCSFLVLSSGIIYGYYSLVLKVDEEEFGGHGALLQEGLFASTTLFLVIY